MLHRATCLHLTPSNDQRLVLSCTGHDNLSQFKIHDFRYQSWQADNQLAGKSLSHANFGLSWQLISQICDKYQNLMSWAILLATLCRCHEVRFLVRLADTYMMVSKINHILIHTPGPCI